MFKLVFGFLKKLLSATMKLNDSKWFLVRPDYQILSTANECFTHSEDEVPLGKLKI